MLFDGKTQIQGAKFERMTKMLWPKKTEQMCWMPYSQQRTRCSPKATYTGGLLGNRKNFFWRKRHTVSQNSLLCYYLLLRLQFIHTHLSKSQHNLWLHSGRCDHSLNPLLISVDHWNMWSGQALASLLLTKLQSEEGTQTWSDQGHGGAWRHWVAITNSTIAIPPVARKTGITIARY